MKGIEFEYIDEKSRSIHVFNLKRRPTYTYVYTQIYMYMQPYCRK